MAKKNERLVDDNILSLSVGEAKEFIKDVLRTDIVPLILGAPGIGKSSILRQIQQAEPDKYQGFIDTRLAQLDPPEVKGLNIPIKREDGSYMTRFVLPEFFPVNGSGIWVFDELTCAPPMVQNAALQLILDQEMYDWKKPKGWKMVAAGNSQKHGVYTQKLSNALISRMIHIEVTARWEEEKYGGTRTWFKKIGILPEIISYIDFQPDNLLKLPNTMNGQPYPTPRTWEFASKLVSAYIQDTGDKITSDRATNLMAAAVGWGSTIQLKGFIKTYHNIHPADIIEKGVIPDFKVHGDAGFMHAAMSSVLHYFLNLGGKTNPFRSEQANNLFKFLKELPAEFQVKWMKDFGWHDNPNHHEFLVKHKKAEYQAITARLHKMAVSK